MQRITPEHLNTETKTPFFDFGKDVLDIGRRLKARLEAEQAEPVKVALFGQPGAGKSSLGRLLVRFWEYEGEIRLGGHDLRRYRPDDLRRLAALPQVSFELAIEGDCETALPAARSLLEALLARP